MVDRLQKMADRLEKINKELIIIEEKINELNTQKSKLSKERIKILQSNCNHEFILTNYARNNYENNTMELEMKCVECGLIHWKTCN